MALWKWISRIGLELALISCLVLACTQPEQPSQLSGYLSRDDDSWQQIPIPVCFEQGDRYQLDRLTIQESVDREFRRAGIFFEGWQTCLDDSSGIRISFDRNAAISRTQGLGRELDGRISGIIMGLKHSCPEPYSGSACQRNIALHEFGHALGLRHEMNRRDNNTCHYDQNDGLGEFDGIQIGSYDPQSIMNYCHLYQANDQNQQLSISEGDILAIKNRYFGVFASLAITPPIVVEDFFATRVIGTNLVSYRYLIVPAVQQHACQNLAAYSEDRSLEQALEIDPTQIAYQGDGAMKLCLLGQSADGNWQGTEQSTSVDFFLLLRDFSVEAHGKPQLKQQPTTPPQHDYLQGRLSLDLEIASSISLKDIRAQLAYEGNASISSITNDRFQTEQITPSRYRIWFPQDRLTVSGPVYLRSLTITDLLGKSLSLFASESAETFGDSEWLVPRIEIFGQYLANQEKPLIKGIESFPSTIQAGHMLRFELLMEEAVGIESIYLSLQSQSDYIDQSVNFHRLDAGRYEISLPLSYYVINGDYQLSRLKVLDVLGNHTSLNYEFPLGDNDGSSDSPPKLRILGGLERENNPPTLLGFEKLTEQIKRNATNHLSLKINDESEIQRVTLELRHEDPAVSFGTIYGIDRGEIAGLRRIDLNLAEHHRSGRYYIRIITITDIFGNTASYYADDGAETFQASSIEVPRFILD